mmetsp:Transcript_11318/g.42272  ORF Transcript_11318/g.42272 Transcript_11318/m.42272 type:complete len:82 (-) Transcript_11318:285-530(-)
MSSGLQELMAAEQRAAQIIQAARSERTEKMKQAQQEAQQVIEEYRSEKETALQKQATQNGGEGGDFEQLKSESEQQLQGLR